MDSGNTDNSENSATAKQDMDEANDENAGEMTGKSHEQKDSGTLDEDHVGITNEISGESCDDADERNDADEDGKADDDMTDGHANGVNGADSMKSTPIEEPTVVSRQRKGKSSKDNGETSAGDNDSRPPIEQRRLSRKEIALKWYNIGSSVFKGGIVRAALVFGNFIVAWRTVVETDNSNQYYWPGWCAVLMVAEFALVVYSRKGEEWKWWSPCFIIYLGTTLPLVWQLQLQQHYSLVGELDAQKEQATTDDNGLANFTTVASNISATTISSIAATVTTATEASSTKLTMSDLDIKSIMALGNDVWVIIVNESLVYLIITARWFLPRGHMKRDDLSSMLLEYLGMASDIMEMLAIFDEGQILANLKMNYWILSIWSLSFLQFIPILKRKDEYVHIENDRLPCIYKNCGDKLAEVVSTFMSMFLQDGPFLVLRLYVMIELDLITYSLMFFVLKNIFTLILLVYRLGSLFHSLPYLKRRRSQYKDISEA